MSGESSLRSKVMTWGGVLLSLGVIYYMLSHVNFADLRTALASADPMWLVLSLGVFLLMFVFRAWRWSVLLGGTRFFPTWHANIIGYMFNAAMPFRLGEVARAYIIAQQDGVTVPRALSAVLIERLVDLGTVMLLFAGFALRVPMAKSFTVAAGIGSVALTIAVLGCVLLVAKGEAVENAVRRRVAGTRRAETVERWLTRFGDIRGAVRSIGSAKRFAQCIALTAVVWALTILVALTCLKAFIQSDNDLTRAGLTVVVANLGGALPSAPGGLGIVQGFATSALVIPFGVPEGAALAFALVWSLGAQLFLIVLGVISLGRIGLSFSEVRKRAQQKDV
jgi:uncharacterized protein (TIRG00374 family)